MEKRRAAVKVHIDCCHTSTVHIFVLILNWERKYSSWFFLQCHQKLEQGLERQHTKLQKTLEELRDYQKQHEKWAKMNSKVIGIQSIPNFPWFQVNSVQAPLEMRVASRLSYERFTFLTEGQIIALPLKWWVMKEMIRKNTIIMQIFFRKNNTTSRMLRDSWPG